MLIQKCFVVGSENRRKLIHGQPLKNELYNLVYEKNNVVDCKRQAWLLHNTKNIQLQSCYFDNIYNVCVNQ